jgi:hypothetical protein
MPAPKRRLTAFVVAIAVLIVTPLAVVASDEFTDVSNSNVHHDDITWLADAGVTLGCNPPTNDNFCPGDPVLRQQMASFLRRLAENQVVDAATAIEANHAATADDADTLDGFDSNEFVRAESTAGADVNIGNSGAAEVVETTLTAPVDGLLIMTATFEADLGNAFGNASADLQFVHNGAATGPVWRHAWTLDDEQNAVTVQSAMPVSAGTQTVALNVTRVTGFVNADSPIMTLQFVPFGGDGLTPAGSIGTAGEPGGAGPGDN